MKDIGLLPNSCFIDFKFIIKFYDLNRFLAVRFMFKGYRQETPTIFNNYFQLNREVHHYATRQKDLLHIPHVRTNLGKQSIRYHGAIIWNEVLRLDFPVETSEAVFVKNLKRCLRGELFWIWYLSIYLKFCCIVVKLLFLMVITSFQPRLNSLHVSYVAGYAKNPSLYMFICVCGCI